MDEIIQGRCRRFNRKIFHLVVVVIVEESCTSPTPPEDRKDVMSRNVSWSLRGGEDRDFDIVGGWRWDLEMRS